MRYARQTYPTVGLGSWHNVRCSHAHPQKRHFCMRCCLHTRCCLLLFCLQSTSRATSYHRHTVTQFHVDAEHSSKQRCSMGYPSPASQFPSARMRMIYASFSPRGPILQFVSPGSLSLLAFMVRRLFGSSCASSDPLYACVCRMRRFSCISLCFERRSRATSARTARWHVRVCKKAT